MSVNVGDFERLSGVQIWQRAKDIPPIEPGRFYGGLVVATGFNPSAPVPSGHQDIYFQDPNSGETVSRVAAYQRYWSQHGPSPQRQEPWLSEPPSASLTRPRCSLFAGVIAALRS